MNAIVRLDLGNDGGGKMGRMKLFLQDSWSQSTSTPSQKCKPELNKREEREEGRRRVCSWNAIVASGFGRIVKVQVQCSISMDFFGVA